MFNGALNVQLGGEPLKIHYLKFTVISGVEHTVYSYLNDASKIIIANQIITAHKEIYNLFGSVIYHKPNYIFK